MTLYRRLCAINYPTVVAGLWFAGGIVLLIGLAAAWTGYPIIALALEAAAVVLIAVPFVLNPWSDLP